MAIKAWQGILKPKSIIEQRLAVNSIHPNFIVETVGTNLLTIIGETKPTARSQTYKFQIDYFMGTNPDVRIISPALVKNLKGENIPHMYDQELLCLHFPANKEYRASDLLINTIIPWVTLWLYYYEMWHVTGKWLGGGVHPIKIITYIKTI
ncbi:MAG: hypothetical protein K0S26_2276 [Bacteroidota bacterium]|jgi:hypothetical protein|nr:hypothetical protein [Bacteroidota bacterium]